MRYALFLLQFAFTIPVVSGQRVDPLSKKFVLDFYKERNDTSKIMFYINGVTPYRIKQMIRFTQEIDTLKNWRKVGGRDRENDLLVLTKEEKKFIIGAVVAQADTSLWADIAIPNAKVISQNAQSSIFEYRATDWAYGSSSNRFSIPIFFRNDTLCAFYYEAICGSRCGNGVFAIYRKEEGRWVQWLIVDEWVS